MPAAVTITNRQHVQAALVLADADGQEIAQLPPGASSAFVSSDPSVSDFVKDASGLSGDVTSGRVGSCRITGTVTFSDGSALQDILDVTVVSSTPTSATFAVGTPVEESLLQQAAMRARSFRPR